MKSLILAILLPLSTLAAPRELRVTGAAYPKMDGIYIEQYRSRALAQEVRDGTIYRNRQGEVAVLYPDGWLWFYDAQFGVIGIVGPAWTNTHSRILNINF